MKKRCRIIMLPTDEASQIAVCKYNERKGIFYGNERSIEKDLQNQHLYITTDEEIKEGDWYLLGNIPRQSTGNLGKPDAKWLKIIATTDPKLYTEMDNGFEKSTKRVKVFIPQIPQSFIEEYYKAGGIDEVDVEYHSKTIGISEYEVDTKTGLNVQIPKVDSHNTITIHPIKDSWSREEVVDLFRKYQHAKANQLINLEDPLVPLEWIKENL